MNLQDRVPVTERGRERLADELADLQARRSLKWSEFAELAAEGERQGPAADDVRQEIARLDLRIAELVDVLAQTSNQVGEPCRGGIVDAGSRVRLRWDDDEEDSFTIVSPLEANVAAGLLSIASPIGRTLLGARRGDEVEVDTPGGLRRLIVLDVVP